MTLVGIGLFKIVFHIKCIIVAKADYHGGTADYPILKVNPLIFSWQVYSLTFCSIDFPDYMIGRMWGFLMAGDIFR